MKTIDLHAHLRRDDATKSYLVDEQLTDLQEFPAVTRMISCLEGPVAKGNDAVAGLVRAYPERFMGCAVIDPRQDDALDQAKAAAEGDVFRAFELNSLEHGYIPEVTANIDEVFDLAAEHNMFVKCFTGWGDHTFSGQWEYYLKRHPRTKTVFLHMSDFWDGYSCIEVAKRNKNLFLDISGVYELSIMRCALREIDHERFLFGSMFPHMRTNWSLGFVDAYELSTEDQENFLYRNAERLMAV